MATTQDAVVGIHFISIDSQIFVTNNLSIDFYVKQTQHARFKKKVGDR